MATTGSTYILLFITNKCTYYIKNLPFACLTQLNTQYNESQECYHTVNVTVAIYHKTYRKLMMIISTNTCTHSQL